MQMKSVAVGIGLVAVIAVSVGMAPQWAPHQDVVGEFKARTQVTAVLPCKWPPRPEDIVNVSLGVSPVGTPPVVVLSTSALPFTVFNVPADKHLVVTYLAVTSRAIGGNAFYHLYETVGGSSAKKLSQARFRVADMDPDTTDPVDDANHSGPFESPTGLVFAPGSEVQLIHEDGPGNAGVNTIDLVGYLRD